MTAPQPLALPRPLVRDRPNHRSDGQQRTDHRFNIGGLDIALGHQRGASDKSELGGSARGLQVSAWLSPVQISLVDARNSPGFIVRRRCWRGGTVAGQRAPRRRDLAMRAMVTASDWLPPST